MTHDLKIKAILADKQIYIGWAKSLGRSTFLYLIIVISYQAGAGELHDAVQSGDVAIVKSLLASGVDINETDYSIGTALHTAVGQGNDSIVELLIAHGADIEALSELNGARALHMAADFDELAIIGLLLNNGADIEARDGEQRTPLLRAAGSGLNGVVEFLIARGAEIGAREGYFGATPLHQAAANGRIETVKLLLVHGAEINAIDNRGFSALSEASQPQSFGNVGNGGLIEFLVDKGANLDVKNTHGQTPLDYAKTRGWKDIAEVLRRLESLN